MMDGVSMIIRTQISPTDTWFTVAGALILILGGYGGIRAIHYYFRKLEREK